jgi:hypothetical protein
VAAAGAAGLGVPLMLGKHIQTSRDAAAMNASGAEARGRSRAPRHVTWCAVRACRRHQSPSDNREALLLSFGKDTAGQQCAAMKKPPAGRRTIGLVNIEVPGEITPGTPGTPGTPDTTAKAVRAA